MFLKKKKNEKKKNEKKFFLAKISILCPRFLTSQKNGKINTMVKYLANGV